MDCSIRPLIKQLHLKSSNSGVSCLEFSSSAHLLIVGHENGDVNFWEQKQNAWESVKTLRDAHVSKIIQVQCVQKSYCMCILQCSRCKGSPDCTAVGITLTRVVILSVWGLSYPRPEQTRFWRRRRVDIVCLGLSYPESQASHHYNPKYYKSVCIKRV